METKICSKCGKELPLDMFNWRDKAKGTRRADCKKCHSGFMKQHYQETKQSIEDIKSERGCIKCGDKRGYLLDFHHINPDTKKFGIARLTSNRYNLDDKDIKEEIKKCVVLCANCHREWHYLSERNSELTFEQYIQN